MTKLKLASRTEGQTQKQIDPEILLKMHRALLVTRLLEDRISFICHNQDAKHQVIPTKGYLSTGQEAISVGSAMALGPLDWVAPSHRDMGVHLVRGVTVQDVLRQYACRATSLTQGRDANVHFGDVHRKILGFISHMGSLLPVANGVAWALKVRHQAACIAATFGDGASSQGIVHEAMNWAGGYKLPVIFILNNNQWAISTPVRQQAAVEDLALRAKGYGFPGITIDGNDVIQVYSKTAEARERALKGEGPTLIECKSFRRCGHGTHDPHTYIPKEEWDEWEKKDPIVRLTDHLVREKILSAETDKGIREEIGREIDAAWQGVIHEPPPDPNDLFKGVYST